MGFIKKLFCWVSGIFLVTFVGLMGLGLWLKSKLPTTDKVALIRVEGVITTADEILRRLKKVEEDKTIKALVLRVNSPGGAVGSAQEIYRELIRIRDEYKKPVVVSMGNVAASGGLYISLPANVILAEGGTITGSIGVILQKLEVKKLADKIGIEVEIIKTGKFKDVLNPFREMTPEEKEYLLKLEEDVLNQFKLAIEENRKGKLKVKVDQIADGRIFSGQQALELGLIDKLGNLEDAIAEAGKLAGIKGKPVVVELKREQPLVKRILGTDLKALSFLDGSTTIGVYYLMY
ncbi:MAG TPA: signal peptide peptidase SppA [Aquifex aeolicus]|uniref:Signal peptide peptidase SppA n=1 Tax=Aquifex aeolicus TaxID=63363 RepID=A0A9D0YN77_AQUAO|nr:signal peptide peptidase SppA [Aquifex aeolicus]